MKYSKKSQVTIFIILGITLLFMIAILIYSITSQRRITEREPVVEEVPIMFEPIENYIEACVRDKTIEALKKLGEHGGYIDMNDKELSGRDFEIDIKNPTESDGVSLSTAVNEPIAYWWYLQSPNYCRDCYVSSLAPSLENIEGQINRFINRELDDCLGDFAEFKVQDFVFDKGEIKTKTIISNTTGGVNVFVTYPIEVKKGRSKANLVQFKATIPLNLNEILRVASSITIDEMDNQSMEMILSYIISAYSGIDAKKLPPIAAIDHEYYSISWVKDVVELRLKELLMANTNYIKVNRTKNGEYYGDTYNIYLLSSIGDPTYLSADFFYLGWPFFFDITPKSGNLLEATTDKHSWPIPILPPTQTNYYGFFYDVSYPTVVMLTDDKKQTKAIFGDSYKFMFAIETNIRDNINLLRWHLGQGTIGPWDDNSVGLTISPSVSMPLEPTKSLMCNEYQKLSGDIEIILKDNKEGEPLEGASISFGCGRYDACVMGATDGEGIYKGKFPICNGGYLLIEKEGYLGKAMALTTEFGKDDLITTSVEPYRELKVNAKVFRMSLPDQCCPEPTELRSGEEFIVMLHKYRDDAIYDQVFSQVASFDENNQEHTIQLVPGRYEVRITYIDNNEYIIHAKCKHICQNTAGIVGCQTKDSWDYDKNEPISMCNHYICPICCDTVNQWIPEEPIEMTSFGGAIFDENTGYLDISRSDLDNQNVDFYAIRVPDSTCLDEEGVIEPKIGMDELDRIDEYSGTFRSQIVPRFY